MSRGDPRLFGRIRGPHDHAPAPATAAAVSSIERRRLLDVDADACQLVSDVTLRLVRPTTARHADDDAQALLLVQRGEQRQVGRTETAREIQHDNAHFVEHSVVCTNGFDRELDDVVVVHPVFRGAPIRPEQVDDFGGTCA